MALGQSFSINVIPGVSTVLQKLDGLKASFMDVPNRANAALDKLALVRTAMARNNAPPSAQSDALVVKQHIDQVKSEWAASVNDFAKLQTTGINLSLDTITTATHLLTSATYVLSNMKTLESSVDTLASKYLTAQQRQAINAAGGGAGAGLGSIGTVAIVLVGAYLLFGRNRG